MTSFRPRFVGAEGDLAAALRPIVERDGRAFLRYCEGEAVRNTKVDGDLILKAASVAEAAHAVQSNLSFRRATVTSAMDELINEFGGSWKLDEGARADWVLTMFRRFRNFCYVISSAAFRTKKPEWFLKLPWVSEPALKRRVSQKGGGQHAAERANSENRPKKKKRRAGRLGSFKAGGSCDNQAEPERATFGWGSGGPQKSTLGGDPESLAKTMPADQRTGCMQPAACNRCAGPPALLLPIMFAPARGGVKRSARAPSLKVLTVEDKSYFYGWDTEVKLAYKVEANDKKKRKIYSMSPVVDEASDPSSLIKCAFADGDSYEPEVIVAQWLATSTRAKIC